MRPPAGTRAGHGEHGDASDGREGHVADPVTPFVIAALEALTAWNATFIHDLGDEASDRLQRALVRAFRPFAKPADGRVGSGK